jgi:hypothetical protein
MVTTAELPAEFVEAYTTDGRLIPAEKLATMLEKERTVLVAVDGKKVDPFFLQLYKEGTIVLIPPPNALNLGVGGAYGGAAVLPVPAPPAPPVERVAPPRQQPPLPPQ